MTPTIFFSLMPRECKLILQGHQSEQEESFFLNFIAMRNAIGACFGGKDFKFENPFEKINNESKPKITKQQAHNELRELFDTFNIDRNN